MNWKIHLFPILFWTGIFNEGARENPKKEGPFLFSKKVLFLKFKKEDWQQNEPKQKTGL